MEIIRKNIVLFVLAILLLCFGFWWYQIRPSQIKERCSWTTYTKPATPAVPAISKEEALRNKKLYDQCLVEKSALDCLFQDTDTVERDAVSAQPAKQAIRNATEAEYTICLKHNGI